MTRGIHTGPMFYRRKLLLSLLEAIGRPLTRTELQKFLFLVCVRQEEPSYEFVPYHYGCYSFQADADKRTLSKYGMVRDCDTWTRNGERKFFRFLTHNDQTRIRDVVDRLGSLRGDDLLRHVYRHYPYYAINSEIADKLLSSKEQRAVHSARPSPSPARLFTIGYEGRTLEAFLNRLISQNIGVLCDVRRNPISRKFGFSKRQLQGAVEGLGITYVHFPELGIESVRRQRLESIEDYRLLFAEYARNTLPKQQASLIRLMELIRERRRVALTCYEARHEQCHRGCVVDALLARPDFQHRVMHL